jgi:4a-hydroxytetrahydrobiopterin dehydratase
MTESNKQHCEPCRHGAPPATAQELKAFQERHRDWEIVEVGGEPRVQRTYPFPDFAEALIFANRVGELAEAENHHPLLTVEWGRVLVAWWTHKIRNIHPNDLLMASKTDEIFGEAE